MGSNLPCHLLKTSIWSRRIHSTRHGVKKLATVTCRGSPLCRPSTAAVCRAARHRDIVRLNAQLYFMMRVKMCSTLAVGKRFTSGQNLETGILADILAEFARNALVNAWSRVSNPEPKSSGIRLLHHFTFTSTV